MSVAKKVFSLEAKFCSKKYFKVLKSTSSYEEDEKGSDIFNSAYTGKNLSFYFNRLAEIFT